MKLNNIAKKLKAYGFVEDEDRKGRMVHPQNTDFAVDLIKTYNQQYLTLFDDECDEIEIGDLRNYVSLTASSITSFRITHKFDGIYFEIKLTSIDGEINLCCAFD